MEKYLIRKGFLSLLKQKFTLTNFVLLEDREDTVQKILNGEPVDFIVLIKDNKIEYRTAKVIYKHNEPLLDIKNIAILPDQGLRVSFDELIKEAKHD